MISDQERLWRERSIEKQPVYYDYPKEGFDGVILYEEDGVTLIQINEYAAKRKKYYVSGGVWTYYSYLRPGGRGCRISKSHTIAKER